jgi:AraC family transcriptional regulator
MLKLYELLENILLDIEDGIKDNISTSVLCKKYDISNSYLRSLFTFAFNQSIAAYIRSRRLAASLNDILETDTNILEIAEEYSFEYEQTYIRAFKREFGITPGDLRKTGQIIKIKPPLRLFNENKLDDYSILLAHDIVIVPGFHFAGKSDRIPFENSAVTAFQRWRQFWDNERKQINGVVNPNICISIMRNINWEEKHLEQIAAVQVTNLKNVPRTISPNGLCGDTFKTSICARFRYIGQHQYSEINNNIVDRIYDAVNKFVQNGHIKYELSNNKTFLAMIDTTSHDKNIYKAEYYTPLSVNL